VPFNKQKQMKNLKYEPTKEPLTSFYCKKTGHIIKDCHAGIVAKARVKQQSNIMTFSKKLYVVNEGHEGTWYTNSGATHHMSHDISLFVTYTNNDHGQVEILRENIIHRSVNKTRKWTN